MSIQTQYFSLTNMKAIGFEHNPFMVVKSKHERSSVLSVNEGLRWLDRWFQNMLFWKNLQEKTKPIIIKGGRKSYNLKFSFRDVGVNSIKYAKSFVIGWNGSFVHHINMTTKKLEKMLLLSKLHSRIIC